MHNQSSCVATASTTTWLSSRFMMLFSTGGEPSLPVCGRGKSTLLSFLVLRERWAARICWPAETRWRSSRPPSPTLPETMDYGTGSLPLLPPWTILFLHTYVQHRASCNSCYTKPVNHTSRLTETTVKFFALFASTQVSKEGKFCVLKS